jgi:hypothetical protein
MIAANVRSRRGYSLTVVLIFVILLFALWSTVYRTTSSLLRVETNRMLQESRDQGPMNALAQALQLLEYSTPYDSANPGRTTFIYGVQIPVGTTAGECVSTAYTVQFTAAPTESDSNRWQIQITPGSSSVPLPNPGDSPQWP